jgi:glyoxylase-like metal-dependent hydrolase (beta-lactamase superfamily II)
LPRASPGTASSNDTPGGEETMTEITRRNLLSGAGTALAATALTPLIASSAAEAAAPGKQVSYYRHKLGDFEVTQLADGARTFPIPDGFVRNLSRKQQLAAIEAAYLPAGKITVPFNPIVINTGPKLVLIDTGYGPGVAPDVGLLPANMAAAGIDPKAIDIVVISHLHPDHINGLKTADGGLAFPNAEIKAPAPDLAFWMNDENMAKAPDAMMKGYFAAARKVLSNIMNKITRYEGGKEVAPGITAIATPGHTPGHMSFTVASGSARMLVQSDVTNFPQFFLRHPDWHVMWDVDLQQAETTRRRFLDMAAAEKALVHGFHFPFPSVGHVEKDGAGYRLMPVHWNPLL